MGKRILNILVLCGLVISAFLTPFYSFASDNLVSDTSKWMSGDDDIKTANIESLSGYYQYYMDDTSSTAYFHISYRFDDLTDESDVEIGVIVSNNLNNYNLEFNPTCLDISKEFQIDALYSNVDCNGQDIYFSIQFLNKKDKLLTNNICVNILIDKVVYPVGNNISFHFVDVTSADSQTSGKTKPTAANKTTKVKKTTTAPSTKFKAPPTANDNTKFSVKNNDDFEYEAALDNNSSAATDVVIISSGATKTKTAFGSLAKIELAVAIVLLVLGFILVVLGLHKKHALKQSQNDDEEEFCEE